jgi:Flp pilus assembly pilin Flp
LIEYSLLALFIAVALISGVSLVGESVDRLWLTIPEGIAGGF